MSIAQAFSAMERGSHRVGLLLGSLALNLFFVGVAIAMAVRSPRVLLGSQRIRARRAARRHAAAEPMPISCAARSTPTARRSKMHRLHITRHRTTSINVLRQEPFDAEAIARRDGENPDGDAWPSDQTDSGRFCGDRFEDFAGRTGRPWPIGRRDVKPPLTNSSTHQPSRCRPDLRKTLGMQGVGKRKGGGNESAGAPVFDHAAGSEPDAAPRRLPADRRQAGAGARYSVVLPTMPARANRLRRKRLFRRSTGGVPSARAS